MMDQQIELQDGFSLQSLRINTELAARETAEELYSLIPRRLSATQGTDHSKTSECLKDKAESKLDIVNIPFIDMVDLYHHNWLTCNSLDETVGIYRLHLECTNSLAKSSKKKPESANKYTKAVKSNEKAKKVEAYSKLHDQKSSPARPVSANVTATVTKKDLVQNSLQCERRVITYEKDKVIKLKDLVDPEEMALLALLEKENIFPLKSKSIRFPLAKYFCRMCDYHMNTINQVKVHQLDAHHVARVENKLAEEKLKSIPRPCEEHLAALGEMVEESYVEYGLTRTAIGWRVGMASLLDQLLKEHFPASDLCLYGSSLSGCGLKTSDINLELVAKQPPLVLKAFYDKLMLDTPAILASVERDFSAKVPSILCAVVDNNVKVQMGVSHINSSEGFLAQHTALLINCYVNIDDRLQQLAVTLRKWAQLAHIDCPKEGSLPSYSLDIMAIYFLQQASPAVLPVLHEIGSLQDRQGGLPDNRYFNDITKLDAHWKKSNDSNVGSLWYDMMRFYASTFQYADHVVCIRQLRPLTRKEKRWTKKMCIEDPFANKRNIASTLSDSAMFQYIFHRFRSAYIYFSTPTTVEQESAVEPSPSPLKVSGVPDTAKPSDSPKKPLGINAVVINLSDLREYSRPPCMAEFDSIDSFAAALVQFSVSQAIKQFMLEEGLPHTSETDTDLDMVSTRSVAGSELHSCPSLMSLMDRSALDCTAVPSVDTVDEHVYAFSLEDSVYKEGLTAPPIICALCHQKGHLKQECPDVMFEPMKALPPMTKPFLKALNIALLEANRCNELPQFEVQQRISLACALQAHIRKQFPKSTLTLFGSSCNGFGCYGCDLDLCMTFDGVSSMEHDECVTIIEALYGHLRKYGDIHYVIAIPTAKVPIVKFRFKRSEIEGDISLYNTLACRNTELLWTYSTVDHRVKILGHIMKVFTKMCDIADASRGSLSSYAYILMVLHFLQQRNPPVIPVLQELHEGPTKPEYIVEGWDTWFYDELLKLPRVWNGFGKNVESVGELWLGLLQYYTEEFNYNEDVVNIRSKSPITRFEKLWNGKCIAIEDPFDQSHNLGAGLSRKMHTYIVSALRRGRELFATPISSLPPNCQSYFHYFFDVKRLNGDNLPPTDKNCHACGKIGHWQRDCPVDRMHKAQQRREAKKLLDQQRLEAAIKPLMEVNVPEKAATSAKSGRVIKLPSPPAQIDGRAAKSRRTNSYPGQKQGAQTNPAPQPLIPLVGGGARQQARPKGPVDKPAKPKVVAKKNAQSPNIAPSQTPTSVHQTNIFEHPRKTRVFYANHHGRDGPHPGTSGLPPQQLAYSLQPGYYDPSVIFVNQVPQAYGKHYVPTHPATQPTTLSASQQPFWNLLTQPCVGVQRKVDVVHPAQFNAVYQPPHRGQGDGWPNHGQWQPNRAPRNDLRMTIANDHFTWQQQELMHRRGNPQQQPPPRQPQPRTPAKRKAQEPSADAVLL